MRNCLLLSMVLPLLAYAGPSWSGFYKCIDASGKATYQQNPCANSNQSSSQIEIKNQKPTDLKGSSNSTQGKTIYTPEWRKDSSFMSAYRESLSSQNLPSWVTELKGPGGNHGNLILDGKEWILISFCQDGNCHGNNISMLYQEEIGKDYALLNLDKTLFVGNPPDKAKQFLIEKLQNNYQGANVENRLQASQGN